MKGGAQVALAVGVGYILGRRRKMRMATMIAAGAAAGGIGGLGPAVLKRGAKMLASTDIAGKFSPQVNEIVNTVRGDLLDAGKAAAATAVTSRMDSLTDSLHERAEAFRNPEAAVAGAGRAAGQAGGAAGEAAGRAGGSVSRLRRRRPAEDEEYLEQDQDERRNGRSGRPQRAARAESDEVEEPDEAEEPVDEYDEEEPYEDELDEPEAVDEIDRDDAEAEDSEAEDSEAGDSEAGDSEAGDSEAGERAPRRTRSSRSPVARTRR
jgi:hypothetical protein